MLVPEVVGQVRFNFVWVAHLVFFYLLVLSALLPHLHDKLDSFLLGLETISTQVLRPLLGDYLVAATLSDCQERRLNISRAQVLLARGQRRCDLR